MGTYLWGSFHGPPLIPIIPSVAILKGWRALQGRQRQNQEASRRLQRRRPGLPNQLPSQSAPARRGWMQRQSSAAQMLLLGACRLGPSLSAAAAAPLPLLHRCRLSRAGRPLLLRLRCAAPQSPHASWRCNTNALFSASHTCCLSFHVLPDLKTVESM